jgi:hypothetical protein
MIYTEGSYFVSTNGLVLRFFANIYLQIYELSEFTNYNDYALIRKFV